jgi:hypothetical protein
MTKAWPIRAFHTCLYSVTGSEIKVGSKLEMQIQYEPLLPLSLLSWSLAALQLASEG